MVKTLVIGDTHLSNKIPGQLNAQVKTIVKIIEKEKDELENIIFLGDVFMRRRPSPSVICAYRSILMEIDSYDQSIQVYVLRGNHDSENKSDDGVTVLSVFDSYPNVHIVTHSLDTNIGCPIRLVAHYEDEEIIKEILAKTPRDWLLFGHFGYTGCINSIGDYDFTIPFDSFQSVSILGHIHRCSIKDKVIILGTPYSINFGDHKKENFYLVINTEVDEDGKPKISMDTKEIKFGIRHLILDVDELKDNKKRLKNKDYFTLLRIYVNPLENGNAPDLIRKVRNDYGVDWVDIKFRTLVDTYKKEISDFDPDRALFSINEAVIEDYVKENITDIPYEELMEGLKELNEDK